MATILLIEDNPLVSRLYRRSLSLPGEFTVETAEDGQKGMEMARLKRYDLVMMDVMMPRMNGLEVLEALHGAPSMEGVPIIVITNLVGEAIVAQAKERGAVRCVIKSNQNPDDIIALVREVLAGTAPGEYTLT